MKVALGEYGVHGEISAIRLWKMGWASVVYMMYKLLYLASYGGSGELTMAIGLNIYYTFSVMGQVLRTKTPKVFLDYSP